jgi:hypothetical protein
MKQQNTWHYEIVKPLRDESERNSWVTHAWSHFVEYVWLAHVVTVHDHHDILFRDIICRDDPRENFLRENMVDVRCLAVDLVRTSLPIAHIMQIVMPCTQVEYDLYTSLDL